MRPRVYPSLTSGYPVVRCLCRGVGRKVPLVSCAQTSYRDPSPPGAVSDSCEPTGRSPLSSRSTEDERKEGKGGPVPSSFHFVVVDPLLAQPHVLVSKETSRPSFPPHTKREDLRKDSTYEVLGKGGKGGWGPFVLGRGRGRRGGWGSGVETNHPE